MASPEEPAAGRLPRPPGLLETRDLAERCRELRERGRRIVFTNGCFDLIHPGHVLYLTEARSLGDVLVVGLNSDASVRALKGPGRPILGEVERAIVLLALRSVDYISIFSEPTPLQLIRSVRPDILVKGGDYAGAEVVGREEVESHGGELRIVSYHRGFSSRQLIRRMRESGTE